CTDATFGGWREFWVTKLDGNKNNNPQIQEHWLNGQPSGSGDDTFDQGAPGVYKVYFVSIVGDAGGACPTGLTTALDDVMLLSERNKNRTLTYN
ncbi:MAG TPA: hypothetical protein VHV83_04035, partial [Armatimonadota bacterium]|nr:hypothetical protein [Armatimonadota bacterium]